MTGRGESFRLVDDGDTPSSGDLIVVGRGPTDVNGAYSAAGIYGAITVIRNDGTGTFPVKEHFAFGDPGAAAPPVPVSATLGDMDRDGDLDVAVATEDDNQIWVLLNDSTGAFVAPSSVNGAWPDSYVVGAGPSGVVAGDLDGDLRMTSWRPKP